MLKPESKEDISIGGLILELVVAYIIGMAVLVWLFN